MELVIEAVLNASSVVYCEIDLFCLRRHNTHGCFSYCQRVN